MKYKYFGILIVRREPARMTFTEFQSLKEITPKELERQLPERVYDLIDQCSWDDKGNPDRIIAFSCKSKEELITLAELLVAEKDQEAYQMFQGRILNIGLKCGKGSPN